VYGALAGHIRGLRRASNDNKKIAGHKAVPLLPAGGTELLTSGLPLRQTQQKINDLVLPYFCK
jgi:hypothetical protein